MTWYTGDPSVQGNSYIITVKATVCGASSSVSYTLTISSTCTADTLTIDGSHSIFALVPSLTSTYDIFDPTAEVSWTDSAVVSTNNVLATCGTLTWGVETTGGSAPDSSIFGVDVSLSVKKL